MKNKLLLSIIAFTANIFVLVISSGLTLAITRIKKFLSLRMSQLTKEKIEKCACLKDWKNEKRGRFN